MKNQHKNKDAEMVNEDPDQKIIEEKTNQDFNKKNPRAAEVKKIPPPVKNTDEVEKSESKEGAGSKTLEKEGQ